MIQVFLKKLTGHCVWTTIIISEKDPLLPVHLHCNTFNPLWPSDVIWWHRSGSTLAQAMAWCHYLNQCWFLISEVHWHSPESYLQPIPKATILYNRVWKSYILLKLQPHLPRANELTPLWWDLSVVDFQWHQSITIIENNIHLNPSSPANACTIIDSSLNKTIMSSLDPLRQIAVN